jgi:hypothetical protein
VNNNKNYPVLPGKPENKKRKDQEVRFSLFYLPVGLLIFQLAKAGL